MASTERDKLSCLDCKGPIVGSVKWMAEDYRDDGGEIDGPYAFHPSCGKGPWPLWECSAAEAAVLFAVKDRDRQSAERGVKEGLNRP